MGRGTTEWENCGKTKDKGWGCIKKEIRKGAKSALDQQVPCTAWICSSNLFSCLRWPQTPLSLVSLNISVFWTVASQVWPLHTPLMVSWLLLFLKQLLPGFLKTTPATITLLVLVKFINGKSSIMIYFWWLMHLLTWWLVFSIWECTSVGKLRG